MMLTSLVAVTMQATIVEKTCAFDFYAYVGGKYNEIVRGSDTGGRLVNATPRIVFVTDIDAIRLLTVSGYTDRAQRGDSVYVAARPKSTPKFGFPGSEVYGGPTGKSIMTFTVNAPRAFTVTAPTDVNKDNVYFSAKDSEFNYRRLPMGTRPLK